MEGYRKKKSRFEKAASFLGPGFRKVFRKVVSCLVVRLIRVFSYLDVRIWSFRKWISVCCLVASWIFVLIGFSVHKHWGAKRISLVGGALIPAYYAIFCMQSFFYFVFRQNEFLGNLLLCFADQFLVHEKLYFQISYFCRQTSLLLQLNHYRIEAYEDEFDPIMIKLLAFHMLTKGLDVISKKQYTLAAQYGVTGLVGLLCILPVADLKTVLKQILTEPWYLLLWLGKFFDSWAPGRGPVADEVKNTTVSGPESSISKDSDTQDSRKKQDHGDESLSGDTKQDDRDQSHPDDTIGYAGVRKGEEHGYFLNVELVRVKKALEGIQKKDKHYGDDGTRKRNSSLKIS
ncbi:hypothetical protein WN944_025201 [Citrus x changshan-huyou]|uniref:Uncharacterized protein n=1 Tax=Citrus x changshan-huyou TaxID=2935761 RepID=A0AAP0QDB8_9ROSI